MTQVEMTDGEGAWTELLDAMPPGWHVAQPSYQDERRELLLYAFDPRETAVAGVTRREWTAVAPTELEVVQEMARCLGEIAAGAGSE